MKSFIYNCHTCSEPLQVLAAFAYYIASHGPQNQKCTKCNAVHRINSDASVCLTTPGVHYAKLSVVFAFPEYKPYRVGAYRVRYGNGNWAKGLATWDGEHFSNGPVLFSDGSIVAWQGLAGDMEHLKPIPYDLVPPTTPGVIEL
jgi:hypothetical protein